MLYVVSCCLKAPRYTVYTTWICGIIFLFDSYPFLRPLEGQGSTPLYLPGMSLKWPLAFPHGDAAHGDAAHGDGI